MKGKAILIATWIGRGTFKAATLASAFVLIVALWFWVHCATLPPPPA